MSENKEYVSRSDELGNIHISEEVLAAISAAAALEVEGVSSLANSGKKSLNKDVRVKMENDKVQVETGVVSRTDTEAELVHSIRKDDGTILFEANTKWRKKPQ